MEIEQPSLNRRASSRLALGKRARGRIGRAVAFVVLCILAVPFVLPFFWMLSTSLKPIEQVLRFPPEWLPRPFVWRNYPDALTAVVPLWRYFINNVIYSVPSTFAEVFSSALIAYAFAKFRARGRDALFILVISTILIPYPVYMIPQFILFQRLGWIDTYLPLMVPNLFGSAFLIFLLRQFMRGISNELIDAARMDGAGPLGIFWRIVLPLSQRALVAAGILSFSFHWNNYLGPLLFLNSAEKYTLQLGLANFIAHRGLSHWELLMAASVISVMPVLIIFFVAQRSLIQGVVVTGMK